MPKPSRFHVLLPLLLALLAGCGKTPDQWLAKARESAAQDRHDKAVDAFDKALAQPGPHVQASQFGKAQSLFALQRWDQAARTALEAAQGQAADLAWEGRVLALRALAESGDRAEGGRVLALLGPDAKSDPTVAEAAQRLGLGTAAGNSASAPSVPLKARRGRMSVAGVNALHVDIAAVATAAAADPTEFPQRTEFQDPRRIVKVPSPDGKKLVWRALDAGKGYYLYLSEADGSGQKRLDLCKNGYQPVWSPDSRSILYSAMDWRIEERNLFIYELATGRTRRAFPASQKVGPLAAWSPDGSKIVFTYFDGLWIMNATGIGRGLLNLEARVKAPVTDARLFAWNPEGSRLAYAGQGSPHVYLIDLTSKL